MGIHQRASAASVRGRACGGGGGGAPVVLGLSRAAHEVLELLVRYAARAVLIHLLKNLEPLLLLLGLQLRIELLRERHDLLLICRLDAR